MDKNKLASKTYEVFCVTSEFVNKHQNDYENFVAYIVRRFLYILTQGREKLLIRL